MKITLHLTKEHIQLIKNFRVQQFSGTRVGINKNDLYQTMFLYDDMANILGYQDKAIKGTEEDADGTKYNKETTAHLDALADDIEKNLDSYEEILHQFCDQGGLREGTYTCLDNKRIWSFEGDARTTI